MRSRRAELGCVGQDLNDRDSMGCKESFTYNFPFRWNLFFSFRDMNRTANFSLFICMSHYVKLYLMMPQ